MKKQWFLRRFLRTVIAQDEGVGSGSGDQGEPELHSDNPPQEQELGEAGIKALKAERDANKAAKANIATLEAKVKAYEDRDKTEDEKRAEQVKQLEQTNAANALKVLQYEVAAEKGIPLQMASRLRGNDRDSMIEDADSLLPLLQIDVKPNVPKADKSQGHSGKPKPATLQDAIAGHFK